MFENEKVKHVKFGEGNVVECDGTHIRILFQCENIEKTFTYPTVFEKFVRFDSQDAQDRVTDDLNTAKRRLQSWKISENYSWLSRQRSESWRKQPRQQRKDKARAPGRGISPSSSIERRLSVRTFWLMPVRSRLSSLK